MATPTDRQGEYSAICLFEGWKIDLQFIYIYNIVQFAFLAKVSFDIILLNLAVRIISIFLLIDLFVFSS